MFASASVDKTVRVWDVSAVRSTALEPKLVAYKTMNVGKLFTLQFSPDDPFLLATGGDMGMLAVWESSEIEIIKSRFEERLGSKVVEGQIQADIGDFEIGSEAKGSIEVDNDAWMETNEAAVVDSKIEVKKKKKKPLRNSSASLLKR